MGCLPHRLPPPPGSHVWLCEIQGTSMASFPAKHSQPQPRHRCTALLLDEAFRSPVTLQTELYIPCNYAIPVTTRRFLPVRGPAGAPSRVEGWATVGSRGNHVRAPLDAPTVYRHATYTWRASSPALAVVVVARVRVAVTTASLLTLLLPWRQALAPDSNY